MATPDRRIEGRRVRCALVGLGQIGATHLQAMQAEGAEVVAIAEPREEVARPVAEARGVRWFADARDPELVEAVDAVVLATPPASHRELASHFLEGGVHVLCEKPLAITSTDARAVLDLARSRGLVIMMASKFRYVEDMVEARRLIEAGAIGAPLLFENAFTGRVPMENRWNARKEVAGGGVLIDNGTHSVDIARFLLGPVAGVHAVCGPSVQGLEVEDTARLLFRTRRGVEGSIDLSWSVHKESESYVAVYGQAGTLLLGWKGSRYRPDGGSAWVPFGQGYDKLRCLRAQFQNFIGVVRGEETPRITPADALASVLVIEAAYASAAESHWRPVPEES